MIRSAAIAILLFSLAACGFQPMYGGAGGADLQADLSGIDIAPIPDRTGQTLQQNLAEQLGGGQGTDYRLEIQLAQTDTGSGFRADEATTRINIMLAAKYQLRRLSDDKIILQDETKAFSAYDVVESQFATLTTRQDTLRGLAEELSRRIAVRLASFFRNQEDSAPDEGTPAGD
jgi:LPS-assembly lipoprotein